MRDLILLFIFDSFLFLAPAIFFRVRINGKSIFDDPFFIYAEIITLLLFILLKQSVITADLRCWLPWVLLHKLWTISYGPNDWFSVWYQYKIKDTVPENDFQSLLVWKIRPFSNEIVQNLRLTQNYRKILFR